MNILELVYMLQETKGSKAKSDMLKANADVFGLHHFLKIIYGQGTNLYVANLPFDTPPGLDVQDLSKFTDKDVEEGFDIVQTLSTRTVTGEAALDLIRGYVRGSEQRRSFMLFLIKKSIYAGISVKGINKAIPNLIYIEPYQRCELPKKAFKPLLAWGKYVSQMKADGMFSSLSVQEGRFVSRDGVVAAKNIVYTRIVNELKNKGENPLLALRGYNLNNLTLEGELIVRSRITRRVLPREESNGLLNKLNQSGHFDSNDYEVQYLVWDCVPTEKRLPGCVIDIPYLERVSFLDSFLNDGTLVKLIDTRFCASYKEMTEHFFEMMRHGQEGTVVKHPDAKYMDGDNNQQIKFKIEAECDLVLTGLVPGDAFSKHAGTFGSLLAESSCGKLQVSISGIRDEMRKYIFENFSDLKGKIVAVKFNDVMGAKSPQDKSSLFLPRFVEIRDDKTVADDYTRILDILDAARAGSSVA